MKTIKSILSNTFPTVRKLLAVLIVAGVATTAVFALDSFTVKQGIAETTYYDEGLIYANKAEVLDLCRKTIKGYEDRDKATCKADDVLNSGICILDKYEDEYIENFGYAFVTISFSECTVYQYLYKVQDNDKIIYIQAFVSISKAECNCDDCNVSIWDLLGIDENSL